jgi:hypothetical protein
MPNDLFTLPEALEQLRRMARRYEAASRGLMHKIADSIEAGIAELQSPAEGK